MAYSIAIAVQKSPGLYIIITQDNESALKLQESLPFFLSSDHGDSEDCPIFLFPDWETLPYDAFSPHQDIISERLSLLYRLPRLEKGIVLIPSATLLYKTCPQGFLESHSLMLSIGEPFHREDQRHSLEQAGYRCVDTVYEHGEFAIRGSLVDIFPMGSKQPVRIDLFDDEIDSLRYFDPETQRSETTVQQTIKLLPAHEFSMTQASREMFRVRFRTRFDVNHRDCPVYQDIRHEIASPGIEYYLPLFFEEMGTLFDYVPDQAILLVEDGTMAFMESFLEEVKVRYERHRSDPERPALPPTDLFLETNTVFGRLKDYARVLLCHDHLEEKAGCFNLSQRVLPDVTFDAHSGHPAEDLNQFLSDNPKNLFLAESAGRQEILQELLTDQGISLTQCSDWNSFKNQKKHILPAITTGTINDGLWLGDTAIIPESQILGKKITRQHKNTVAEHQAEQVIRNLTELREGAPVVHLHHGVGRYRGLKSLVMDGQPAEFLMLEYANDAKLYVPVGSLQLIARYTGADEETAPLHRLGSEQWSKARRKAAEKARDVAAELLDIYACRQTKQGFACSKPEKEYLRFASAFPFDTTPDQQQAIDSVIHDMCHEQPMDRLVCGDVGFGKTEVAMRAAFLAVQNNKQVVILVPTTLLAQQHYDSFRDRFASWPIEIDVMSRFRSAKSLSAIRKKVEKGTVDILIGTHKILQDFLKFHDLGLLIIDEEHRFGVRHKEKLKSLRSEVDILTLTATPIPRTLNMSMSGIRDLSIIATPPARRLSIRTFIQQQDDHLIKEAISRELLRGGQVYFLHNEVKTIEKAAEDLQNLVPEARISIGHGQMRERDLEQVMSDFYHKRSNVLVCSTIIETGIDVPGANTIIINRADRFGLAQLHQLRGRVGRSHHQAYAYLLTPSPRNMSKDAIKRLEAISEANDLGAGFMLASHDLEIRGAGELLGEGQSGQIQGVGFTLYTEMLEQAIETIKSGQLPDLEAPLHKGTEINLGLPALLPDEYIHDIHTRLVLYKRIAAAINSRDLKDIQVELIDRFGLIPSAGKNLFQQTELKLRAEKLGIIKINADAVKGRIEFMDKPAIEPIKLIQLIQMQPNIYHLEGSNILKYSNSMQAADKRFQSVEVLLDKLSG
ncbi:Transcription-repair-coupling factor [invertebrate metagenome]|uniref:Transcription-repair-coupling factor n=1 Tax=invertebrate metagenome TaxID=1711999 RepID=A0A2H9T7W4_9ZZZZ